MPMVIAFIIFAFQPFIYFYACCLFFLLFLFKKLTIENILESAVLSFFLGSIISMFIFLKKNPKQPIWFYIKKILKLLLFFFFSALKIIAQFYNNLLNYFLYKKNLPYYKDRSYINKFRISFI